MTVDEVIEQLLSMRADNPLIGKYEFQVAGIAEGPPQEGDWANTKYELEHWPDTEVTIREVPDDAGHVVTLEVYGLNLNRQV